MKKILVFILTIVLVATITCSAIAEVKDYILSALKDADGNTLVYLTEDMRQALDGYGNDITEEWTMLYFTYDDETMAGTFGTAENKLNCTLEAASGETDLPAYTANMENGEVMTLYHDQENDIFTYSDPQGQVYTMTRIS